MPFRKTAKGLAEGKRLVLILKYTSFEQRFAVKSDQGPLPKFEFPVEQIKKKKQKTVRSDKIKLMSADIERDL